MIVACTRLIAAVMVVFMLVRPLAAEDVPVYLSPPQGSVLIRNDPEVGALLDQALDAAELGDSAAIKRAMESAETLIARKNGATGRHMAVLQQEAASDFAIAGNVEEALARGLKSVGLGRDLAASYVFYRGMTAGISAFDQTEPFREFLLTAALLMDGADLALSRRLTAEAFKAAQLAHMTKAGLAVLRHQARRNAATPRRGDEVRLVQILVDTIADTGQTARDIDAGLYGEVGSPERTEMVTVQDARLQNLREAIALIAKEKIGVADILLPQPLEADAVQGLLGPDEALVFFVGSWVEVHGFVITREAVTWREIALKAPEIDALIARFRAGIGAPLGRGVTVLSPSPAPGPDDVLGPAARLYQTLLGPFAEQLRGKTHLMVAADGELAKLPFEALLVEPPPPAPIDARKLHWLVRDHAVTVLPVLSIIAERSQEMTPDASGELYLGIGDPDYAAVAGEPRLLEAVEALGKLKPLPESADEVRRIADAFGVPAQHTLIGKEASEEKLYALSTSGVLARYRMLLFATHGLLPGEVEGLYQPALALTPSAEDGRGSIMRQSLGLTIADGLLTASEILQLKLKADIVVLSACNTGADSPVDSEAYSGLAAAFLSAGARSVMVSHWPVQSDAAVAITTGTIAHWASRKPGRDFAFAFRQALLEVIDKSPETAKPAYWAPFSLFGTP